MEAFGSLVFQEDAMDPRPTRRPYPSDLTDAQWELVRPLLPPPPGGGRPRTIDPREIVDAILYVAKNGGA
jgi:putative transposase